MRFFFFGSLRIECSVGSVGPYVKIIEGLHALVAIWVFSCRQEGERLLTREEQKETLVVIKDALEGRRDGAKIICWLALPSRVSSREKQMNVED